MLGIIVAAFSISTLLNIVLKKYRFPTIIGYITTGTIITYSFGLHTAINNHELKEIAEFGVVFLMFTIGLEFSIEKMKRMRYEVFVSGSIQVTLTTIIFIFIGVMFFDVPVKDAIIISAALSLSSTAIVLKLLNETGEIKKKYGQRVLGILLFQDIAVIPILLVITIFAQPNQDLTSLLTQTLVSAIILMLLLWGLGKYVIEHLFALVSHKDSNEMFISTVLFIVIGASYLAQIFGFSYSLGAFVAGMMIAETHYKHQVEADLVPFRDLLLGVFFITVGMQINFEVIINHFSDVVLFFTIIVSVKIAVIYLLVKLNSTKRVSIKTALSLFQVGEFALAIFELARSKDLFDPVLGQILIVTVVLSMIITPLMIRRLSYLVDWSYGDSVPYPQVQPEAHDIQNHVVVIGYSYFGQKVTSLLREQSIPYLVLEHDLELVALGQSRNEPIIFGNAAQLSILESVRIEHAKAVIVAVENPEKLHLICSSVDALTHNANTIVKVTREIEKVSLSDLHLTHVIVEGDEISHKVVQLALAQRTQA